MAAAALLACDWGTTNLRAWTLDADGRVLARRELPLGVSQLRRGEAAQRFEAEVRPALDAAGLPAILCGMVGSDLGWTAVPYADCPAALQDLARRLATVEASGAQVRIAPGLRGPGLAAGGADVMRGEETQVFGWIEQDPLRRRGRHLICHPGTHAKWVMVEEGRILRFVTAMTGELFAVLRRHSVLRSDAEGHDAEAFDEGLAAAGEGDALAARLFSARSRVTALGRPADSTPSYLSGLLIGAEIAAVPPLLGVGAQQPMVLLGDPELCALYGRALGLRGVPHETFDGEAAAVAGLFALHRLGGDR